MSTLTLYRGSELIAEHVLMKATVGVGRHPENDIVLEDMTLSRFHARLERRGDHYVVVDLGAHNGIVLNGARINGECMLSPGDAVGLGSYRAVFDQELAERQSESLAPSPVQLDNINLDDKVQGTSELDVRDFDDSTAPVRTNFEPTLVLLYNGLEVSRYPVDGDLVVGRSKNCDVVISLLGLSRRHAQISISGQEVFVEDLGSQNGTWINNHRVETKQKLVHGDLLNFYEYGVLYVEDPNVEISFSGGFADPADDKRVPAPITQPGYDEQAHTIKGQRDTIEATPGAATSGGSDPDISFGEGSFLAADFDGPHLVEEEHVADAPPPDETTGVEFDTSALNHNSDDLDDAIREELNQYVASEQTRLGYSGFDDRTAAQPAGAFSTLGRGGWPTDDDLELALAQTGEQKLASVEVYLDDRIYTQMPLSNRVTRIGTDARCELALPPGAGLARWQMTLVQFGSAAVCFRASANARITIDEEPIDQAVLRDGQVLQLGRIRIVYKCR